MNKEASYTNLSKWCEKYKENNGIKIHPSSVPVELVIEDLLGKVADLDYKIDHLLSLLEIYAQESKLSSELTPSNRHFELEIDENGLVNKVSNESKA